MKKAIKLLIAGLLFIGLFVNGCSNTTQGSSKGEILTGKDDKYGIATTEQIKVFKADRITKPTKFIVYIELDDYYNYEFRNFRDSYYSLDIFAKDVRMTSLNGFIHKMDPGSQDAIKIIRDGKMHIASLEMEFVSKERGGEDSSNCLILQNIKILK